MRQLRVLWALCAVLAATAIAGCGGGVPGSAVATVEGETIDKRSFDHWLEVAAKSSGRPNAQVPKPPDYAACVSQKRKFQPVKAQTKPTDTDLKQQCQQEYDALREQVVQLLVTARWLDLEASERGISVKDVEVKEAFAEQRKQSFPKDAQYQEFLEDSGQTEQDVVMRVRLDLLSNKIREQVTKGEDKVTEQQIALYYKVNKARFAQPERRDLRIVLTGTQARAERAKAALATGASWKSVAKEHSIDRTSKADGGKLLAVTEGQQEKTLDEAVFAAPEGRITGPVETQFGFYLFEVTRVLPGSQQTLEQAKATIKQLLIAGREQKKLDDFTKRFRDKWKAKTECREGYVTQDCRNAPRPTPTPAQQTGGGQPVPPQP